MWTSYSAYTGSVVFWQIDRNSNVRAGKIMGYDAVTGHRIKEPFNQVSWVHSVRKVQDFRMKQCLFGEHLLSDNSAVMSAKPVAIVESEKTALVAAHFIPDFIWLATGGIHGCFKQRRNGGSGCPCWNPYAGVPHASTCWKE